MKNWERVWDETTVKHTPGICLKLGRKTRRNSNHCSLSQDRNFNPDPAEYEAIMIFIGTYRFVWSGFVLWLPCEFIGPIPVAGRSKAWAWVSVSCECWVLSDRAVSCECWVLSEVPASGWSLAQRSPTECDVPALDREVSIMMGLWPTRGCCAMGHVNLLSV
jgi:hypothetical protein